MLAIARPGHTELMRSSLALGSHVTNFMPLSGRSGITPCALTADKPPAYNK